MGEDHRVGAEQSSEGAVGCRLESVALGAIVDKPGTLWTSYTVRRR